MLTIRKEAAVAVYKEAENVPRVAYRVKEVALALDLSPAAVYQHLESGRIPYVRIGGRVFVPAGFFRESGLEEPSRTRYADGARLGIPPGYTVAEVAATFDMSIPNVYELTSRGVIPKYKEGGRRLISADFFVQVGLDAPVIDLAR